MGESMSIRYTFFELATQKGHIMVSFNELLPRHWVRRITSTPDGEAFLFEARKYEYEPEPLISVTITGRGLRETTAMWQERARREAHTAWESYVQERQRLTQERQRLFGADGRDGEAAKKRALLQLQQIQDDQRAKALLSSTAASLTPSPTAKAPSSSTTSAAASAPTDSVPSGQPESVNVSTNTFTGNSKPASKRSASKSRVSSG